MSGLPENKNRLYFIDNIRWVMIILVLSMHAAVTYSNQGGWYYLEKGPINESQLFFFITYQSFLQSFFMPLLFFIAGYFVPSAFWYKGPAKFIKARAFRLGWPTLLYVFILGPLTEYFISYSWHPDPVGRSFSQEYGNYILRFRFIGGTGPLWFCEALLLFCLLYAGYITLFGIRETKRRAAELSWQMITLFVMLVGVSIFLIRIPCPKGTSFFNLQLPYFAGYLLFFAAGISTYSRDWFSTLSYGAGKRAGWLTAIAVVILWPFLLYAGGAFNGQEKLFQGGKNWQSLGLSVWESIVGVCMSLFLIVFFREKYNFQNKWTKFLSANAFAVYVFHPPILILIARGMGGLYLNPILKFVLLTCFSVGASFLICSWIRKLPVLNKIL